MKTFTLFYLIVPLIILSFASPKIYCAQSNIIITGTGSVNDTLHNGNYLWAIKLNPFQPILSEAPLSFEFFGRKNSGFQVQIGYIFPRYNSYLYTLMNMQGEEAMATDDGIFSYRISPFNNYGFSTKLEFRKYSMKGFYSSLQLMYKYCFYNNLTFGLHHGGMAIYQKESKDSNICGLGLMFGKQTGDSHLLMDWYFGGGIRTRSIHAVIDESWVYGRPSWGTSYVDKQVNSNSVYLFVNLGYRIGFRFGKK